MSWGLLCGNLTAALSFERSGWKLVLHRFNEAYGEVRCGVERTRVVKCAEKRQGECRNCS